MDIEGFERDAPTEDVAVALYRDGAPITPRIAFLPAPVNHSRWQRPTMQIYVG